MGTTLRTPLKKVRGIGAAGHGASHFIQQRASAVALAILLPWFTFSVIFGTDGSYGSVASWLGNPINAMVTVLLALTGLFHMRLGLSEIVADYIHRPVTKSALLIGLTFLPLALAILAVLAVLRVYAGA